MDVQQIATLGIVAVAGTALARRFYHHARGTSSGSCPGCGECGREPRADLRPAPKATPLVTLSLSAPIRRKGPGPEGSV